MADVSILKKLYSRTGSALDFYYEKLTAPPILSLLTPQDISYLDYIATSIKLSSKTKQKFKMIDEVMNSRGFKKFSAGTNRLVYRYLENNSIVVKVAYDKVALQDNLAEYKNQFLIKPFCTKVFETVPSGVVGLFERVEPIKSQEEFLSIAYDYFDMLYNKISGKYVMEDVGTKYFMNVGVRTNFGPVLLDFPYIYALDGDKLYCNFRFDNGQICNGEIEWDDGFNYIKCSRCGKVYRARELEKADSGPNTLIIKKGRNKMRVEGRRGDEVVVVIDNGRMSKYIAPLENPVVKEKKRNDKICVEYANSSTVKNPNKITTAEREDDFSEEIKGIIPCNRNKDESAQVQDNHKQEIEDVKDLEDVSVTSESEEKVISDSVNNESKIDDAPESKTIDELIEIDEQKVFTRFVNSIAERLSAGYDGDTEIRINKDSEHVEINDCIAKGVHEALEEIDLQPRSPFINSSPEAVEVESGTQDTDETTISLSETSATDDVPEISFTPHPKHNKKRSVRYDKNFYKMGEPSKGDQSSDIKRVR